MRSDGRPRVADRAILVAIGGILLKKVLGDIKQPSPRPEVIETAREDAARAKREVRDLR